MMVTPSSSGIASVLGAAGTYPPPTDTCAQSVAVTALAASEARMERAMRIMEP